jgi:hypothetical protein
MSWKEMGRGVEEGGRKLGERGATWESEVERGPWE